MEETKVEAEEEIKLENKNNQNAMLSRLRKRSLSTSSLYLEKQTKKKLKDSLKSESAADSSKKSLKSKTIEFEDEEDVLLSKCRILGDVLRNSKHCVVYTGAGISTACNIPDYRGTEGVWTKINSGHKVEMNSNITKAEPSFTHMGICSLLVNGIVKHVVSQNCDGLHIRSGVPPQSLSEIHGNMYIEVCTKCNKQCHRAFDVTLKTRLRRHLTGRKCPFCGGELRDSIVHFGEKGNLIWPHNWIGATTNAEKADVILCLGSSLKVLRHYKDLWCMDRLSVLLYVDSVFDTRFQCLAILMNKRPKVYIVNLQWTPKDLHSSLKINGKVDRVMKILLNILKIQSIPYNRERDPLFELAIELPKDQHQKDDKLLHLEVPENYKSKFQLVQNIVKTNTQASFKADTITDTIKDTEVSSHEGSTANIPSWFGKGLRKPAIKKKKRGRPKTNAKK